MINHLFYWLLLIAMGVTLPSFYWDPDATKFIFLIGIVAIWRYSWAVQHFVRAMIFIRRKFPRMRAQADALGEEGLPRHAFFIVTSFRIDSETSASVYREAVREAIDCGVPATVIASVVEMADERLVKRIFSLLNPPDHVGLKLVRIPGTGKRDALAAAFRAVSNTHVLLEDTVVSVIDGDSILSPGCSRKCFPLFKLNPKLGALTTDEECVLEKGSRVTGIYRRWYNLRFAQRTMYMASLALSNRVLTLTGRMSMFRGSIVGDPEFINRVEYDTIEHWRLGKVRFLTGDDKSSWYHVIKDGWEMTFVPDATVKTVEAPPHRNFFLGASMLMRRWFGNMLRTNARARKIPARTMGIYTWWCLRDQVISMWTSLFGLFIAVLGTFMVGPVLLVAFGFWILLTRYLIALGLSLFHGQFSLSWPILVYFNQIYGSLVKIYMFTHLHKQRWTRQKTTLKSRRNRWQDWLIERGSDLAWLTAMLVFTSAIAWYVGLLTLDDFKAFRTMLESLI